MRKNIHGNIIFYTTDFIPILRSMENYGELHTAGDESLLTSA